MADDVKIVNTEAAADAVAAITETTPDTETRPRRGRPAKALNDVTVVDEVTEPTATGEPIAGVKALTEAEQAINEKAEAEQVKAESAQADAGAPATDEPKPVVVDADKVAQQVNAQLPNLIHNAIDRINSNGFVLQVANGGFADLTEPLTLTKIKAGQVTSITCQNAAEFGRVRSNIQQLISLGRPLEIK